MSRYALVMRKLCISLFALLSLTPWLASAGEMYRWVDNEGVTHYSDQPQANAERINIKVPKGFSRQSVSGDARTSGDATAEKEPASGYTSIALTQPANGQTLWNIGGNLQVVIALQPALQEGHRLQLTMDGRAAMPSNSTRQTMLEVFRGEHTMSVRVVDGKGATIIQSQPTTFFVQQTSIANQQNRPRS